RIVLKHKWTILSIFTIVVVTTIIYSYTAIPLYQASTRIIIEKENPNVVSIQEVMAVDASGTDYYQTQYKIIESRSIAREVIKRLSLDKSEEFFPKIKDNFIQNFKTYIKDNISSIKDSIISLLKIEKPEKGKKENEDDSPDKELVSIFISRVNVAPIRNSRLVDLNFEARDPKLASDIANALAQAYIDQNLDTKLKVVQDAVKWLHERIEVERQKVDKAEKALLQYKEKHGIITDFSSDTEKVTAQKLAQLNEQVVNAEAARVEAETRYKQAAALRGSPGKFDSIPEVIRNELIKEINTMEVELYKKMSEFSKKYGSNHPQMIAIESELKTLMSRKQQEIERVINSLYNEYRVTLAKEMSLKESLGTQKKESLSLNEKAIEFMVLQRETESAREMYNLLIKRFKETTMTEDMKTGNIRVVDKAEVPEKPIKPKKKRNIILSVFIGLFFGIGLAFFFEYLDNTIKIPEDIKNHLKIPYLGPVPYLDIDEGTSETASERPELITFHSPKSTASEAYRGIRTGILFSSAGSEPRVILVSSAGPQEGKTLTSTNLAITMAQSGNKVVIIDCDLRRPKVHKMFNLSRDIGMTNVLVGNKKIDEVVLQTGIPNLSMIPSGPIPPNPSEILGSNRMKDILELLKEKFDKVIIDTPPITAVTDAVILSKAVDGVVLVVRANDTIREIAKNGVDQILSVGGHLLGAILNGVDIGKDSYYYYQYYYYYYGEDGERKKKARRKKRAKSHYYSEKETDT
ncbi:MAG: polysaccharide biosynthesis tyrosine autokinase, partial [Desulfobacterales bacterium]|nr:polysaccharide biosynthesis tyrosine autokinase [Desulfobacterales bacterium]